MAIDNLRKNTLQQLRLLPSIDCLEELYKMSLTIEKLTDKTHVKYGSIDEKINCY